MTLLVIARNDRVFEIPTGFIQRVNNSLQRDRDISKL